VAYAKLEPSGCGTHKDRAKLRIDLFLEVGDPNYDKAHAYVVDETCPEFKAGYKGKLDAEGNPDFADYEKWRDGLPHVWRDNPFHSHFIYPDKEATDADIKAQIDRTLTYFYTFHQQMWDTDKKFIDEWKKVPKVKGSIRDIFVKGDPKDRVFNQQKVANILSRKQEFQIGVSRVPPTDLNIGEKGTIDVGETTNLSYGWSGYTLVDKANPANADGTIDTVLVYPNVTVTNVELATFYVVSGNNLTSRDNETYIGEIASGGERTLTGLSIDILTTDYIGLWHDSGKFYGVMSGAGGLWYAAGDKIPSDNQAFSSLATASVYLYGTGTESGGGSAALTGTATDSITEADVVTGGKTIILTLTDDTWVADDGTFDAQRQNIINGMDSAQSEGTGWDAEVKGKEVVGAVVRTSDTVVTITLTAQAAYDITATETITVTIPGTALVGAEAIVAAPTFDVTHIPPSGGQPTMKRWGGVPYMGINRGVW